MSTVRQHVGLGSSGASRETLLQ